jgi:hypothetical protein
VLCQVSLPPLHRECNVSPLNFLVSTLNNLSFDGHHAMARGVPLSREKEKTLRPGSRALQCTASRTVQHAVNAGRAATRMARMNGERQLRRRRPVRSDDGQPSIGRPRSSLPTRGPHEARRARHVEPRPARVPVTR